MSGQDVLVTAGTVSLSLLAALTYLICSTNGYKRYGREAGFVAVFVYVMLVAVRVGRDELGVLTPALAFQVASAGYIAALLILGQVAWMVRRPGPT